VEFDWINGAVIPYWNFLLFFVLLIYVARKPIKEMVQSRHQTWVDLHAEAKKAFEDAQAKHDELKEKMANLDKEIEELKQISMQNAQHEYDAVVEQAKQLGEHIVDEARMIADAEVESAKERIRQQIVEQLTESVQTKISNDVDQSKHDEIFNRQAKSVEAIAMEGANV